MIDWQAIAQRALGAPSSTPGDVIWSIYPPAITSRTLRRTESMADLARERDADVLYTINGTTAIIEISGVMVPARWYDDEVSTLMLTDAVQQATQDDRVEAIVLAINSPGGSVTGLAELADAVQAARAVKPVLAQVCGMCCSAAYLIASQADSIYAHRMDLVGSIGTRMYLIDASGLFANIGLKAVAIDTGEFKSTGALGTELSESQQAYLQHLVDGYQQFFAEAVQRGRSLVSEELAEIADGRCFLAAEALTLGLIDGVQVFDETISQLSRQTGADETELNAPPTSLLEKDSIMPKATTGNSAVVQEPATSQPTQEPAPLVENSPAPATLAELKQTLPGATSDFLIAQLEANATVSQALQAYTAKLAADNAALQQQLQQQAAAAATPPVKPTEDGFKGLADVEPAAPEASGDCWSAWQQKVAETMQQRGCSKAAAVREVARLHPELREAVVAVANI